MLSWLDSFCTQMRSFLWVDFGSVWLFHLYDLKRANYGSCFIRRSWQKVRKEMHETAIIIAIDKIDETVKNWLNRWTRNNCILLWIYLPKAAMRLFILSRLALVLCKSLSTSSSADISEWLSCKFQGRKIKTHENLVVDGLDGAPLQFEFPLSQRAPEAVRIVKPKIRENVSNTMYIN